MKAAESESSVLAAAEAYRARAALASSVAEKTEAVEVTADELNWILLKSNQSLGHQILNAIQRKNLKVSGWRSWL